MVKKLEGRRILITGPTRGIGRVLAERFAKEGASLVLVGRGTEKLEALDDALAVYQTETLLVPLDLRKVDAIDEMAHALATRYGALDGIVGNAGVLGSLGPIVHQEAKVWDEVMDVNVTANWRLMRAFDPLLKAAPSGRAIFVTSGVARAPHPYWNAYSISKVALERLVMLYAMESEGTSVRVNLLDPGVVRTDMRAKAFPGEDPLSVATPEEIMDAFVYLASAQCQENGQIISAPQFRLSA